MKVEITKAQLEAIIEMANNLSGMSGGWDDDLQKETENQLKLIDRFLNKNGYKRQYK